MAVHLIENFLKGGKGTILTNPRMNAGKRNNIVNTVSKVESFENYLWLQSSGTSAGFDSGFKVVAFARNQLAFAAKMVVDQFQFSSRDRFLLSLPSFHIAGVSIISRALVCGAALVKNVGPAWDPKVFLTSIDEQKITVLSLVPTQIYDLMKIKAVCPKSIRTVFVGGGPLAKKLAQQAKDLGWPLVTCYGMTETSAMIAFNSSPEICVNQYTLFDAVLIQPNLEAKAECRSFFVEGPFVCQGLLFESSESSQMKLNGGRFLIPDQLKKDGRKITYFGRTSEFVKILGESINLSVLEKELEQISENPSVVLAYPVPRRGYQLLGFVEGQEDQNLLIRFNQSREPFLNLSEIIFMQELPRNALGKIEKSKIQETYAAPQIY